MNRTRLLAMMRKETIQIVRDPRSLAIVIVIPVLLLILFGYAVTLDVKNIPIAVLDRDGSRSSRDLLHEFTGSPTFSLRANVRDEKEIERLIDQGDIWMGLVIPPRFGTDVAAGRAVSLQVILDGTDSNTALIVLGYARSVVARFSRSLQIDAVRRLGIPAPGAVIDPRIRVWFNEELESKNYIVPGLIAVIMAVIGALLTSLTVAREWERGTMELLISTPIGRAEIVAGKMIPYFVVGLLDVALAVAVGAVLFQVPLRGNFFLLALMSALFLIAVLAQGFLISAVTRSQVLASQFALVTTFLPAFLLSGFIYAIANMPKALQIITHILPARYLVRILKVIYLKGLGLTVLAFDAAMLLLFSVVLSALCVKKIQKWVSA